LETQGVKLAEENKLDEALDKLSQAIKICDYYASVYNNRAQVYRLKNDLASAVTDLEQAMKYGVGQPKVLRQAYTQRAIIRKQQGDIEGAQADFERGNFEEM
jgi:tetratricopeptide (TPR) repeat protein